MNGIEKITEKIQNEMQQEIDSLLLAAEEASAAIKKSYEEQAQTIYNETLAKGKQDAAARIERQTRVAELEARKLILKRNKTK